jgi:hypothetical protein
MTDEDVAAMYTEKLNEMRKRPWCAHHARVEAETLKVIEALRVLRIYRLKAKDEDDRIARSVLEDDEQI